jgi:hypothetical protein
MWVSLNCGAISLSDPDNTLELATTVQPAERGWTSEKAFDFIALIRFHRQGSTMVQPNRFLFSTRARARVGACVRACKGIQLDQLDHIGPHQLKYGFSKNPRGWTMPDHWVDRA